MLYEADFNFMLKLIWGKRLVRHAEKYKCLGTENKGSRLGYQTTDAMLEKLFLYEYARLTRTSLITVNNNAISCYDRIIKPLAMLACMAVGLPLMAKAMHNKTNYGMMWRPSIIFFFVLFLLLLLILIVPVLLFICVLVYVYFL